MAQRKQAGFSLVELMVVVAILGILATVVAVNVIPKTITAIQTRARVDLSALRDAIDLYLIDVHRYPRSLDELIVAPADAPTWGGPYLRARGIPVDPWGKPYVYRRPGADGAPYDLISYGADRLPGGEDEAADITLADLAAPVGGN